VLSYYITNPVSDTENTQLSIAGRQEFAEVQYYFQMIINNEVRSLALVSIYSPPDWDILSESYNTLWACMYQGDEGLKVVDVKSITAFILMPPLPGGPDGTFFVLEKPGLDVMHMGGQDEVLTEE
jgi:hypothetical protein